jgi:hypothetical protein
MVTRQEISNDVCAMTEPLMPTVTGSSRRGRITGSL